MDRDHSPTYGAGIINHLLGRDFTPTAWGTGFHEWLAEGGAWESSDPTQVTHNQGGAPDNIVLQPGVPSRFSLASIEGGEGEWAMGPGQDLHPAATFPVRLISDHHPVLSGLPGSREEEENASARNVRRLQAEGLSDEEWVGEINVCPSRKRTKVRDN